MSEGGVVAFVVVVVGGALGMKLRMSGIMKSSSSSACSSSSSSWSGRVPWEGPSQATAAALMFWRASHTIEGGGGRWGSGGTKEIPSVL